MALNTLYLFSNVRITPDYSVVHDMDPDTWHDFLMGWLDPMPPGADQQIVYSNNLKLNYYRMPDTLRIEGNYDKLKNATYGFLQDGMYNDQQPAKTSFKYIFFWVKDVRLITQRTSDRTEGGQTVFDDVVELELEMDTWSTYGVGAFELYDSFVERRHMDRWVNKGTDLSPDWQPIYYPNAGQGVEGAYLPEDTQDATASLEFTGLTQTYTPTWIIISAIDPNGVLKTYIGGFLTNSLGNESSLYFGLSPNDKVFGWEEVVSGTIYAAIGLTADNIQSITCVSSLGNGYLDNFISWDSGQNKFLVSNIWGHANGLAWFEQGTANNLSGANSQTVNVIAPDHDATPVDGEYLDEHEPMMYMSPARVRKIVSGIGGEAFTIPDVIAFEDTVTTYTMFDVNQITQFVMSGSDLVASNLYGAIGAMVASTLPIFNSAWKSYEAINKVGDEIAYNAKQMQSLANGAAGTASSAIMGGFVGNAAGAIMGAITGIVSTGTAMYGNAEELRAKQVTIKNSPCNVKSGGSGLGAYVKGLTDVFYITLKMDDQSMEKLRFMYYWYGYHVNRMFKGTVDLHTRSKFDYIKTNGAKIKGSLSAGAARQIAAIFDSGVTIYHGADGYLLIGTGDMKENDEI